MSSLHERLATDGPALAMMLKQQHHVISADVATRTLAAFPRLCYDSARPDAAAHQEHSLSRTPERIYQMLQIVLQFGTLGIVDREYRWMWQVAAQHGVQQEHVLSVLRWYFDAAREHLNLDASKRKLLDSLDASIIQIVTHITSQPAMPVAPLARIIR